MATVALLGQTRHCACVIRHSSRRNALFPLATTPGDRQVSRIAAMTMPRRHGRLSSFAWLLAGVLAAASAGAAPKTYQLDPVHTRVLFAISHAGFSQAMGTVSGSTGLLQFDPDDWSQARVEVSVPLERTDLGDAAWNKAVAAGNLLDIKDHPQASFVSTRVVGTDPTHAQVTGNLTLHGVTREVTLAVTFNQLKRHPLPPFRRTAGFSATATISRADFGITAWKSVIGDTVQLTIQAEATRSGKDFEDGPDQDPDNAATQEPAPPDAVAPSPTDASPQPTPQDPAP
jgi:polyisoprenoid-binding protein YceI